MAASYDEVLQNPDVTVESAPSAVVEEFKNTDGISEETVSAIEAILADVVADGGSVVQGAYVADMTPEQVQEKGITQLIVNTDELGSDFGAVASAAPIVMLGEGVKDQTIVISADAATQAITVSNGGGNTINVAGASTTDMTVQLGGGAGDTVSTAQGNDSITFTGGSATINTGTGEDVVVIGQGGEVNIKSDGGMLTVRLDENATGTIDATITGTADSMDQVATKAQPDTYDFSFDPQKGFIMSYEPSARAMDATTNITMTDVNVVSYDVDDQQGLNPGDSITILARNEHQSLVARLYQIGLGRQAIDSAEDYEGGIGALGGLDFWYGADANNQELAYKLLNSDEFHEKTNGMDNAEYVKYLFENAYGEAKDDQILDGMTQAEFVAKLDERADDPNARFDIAWWIAKSDKVGDILGNEGTKYVIDGEDFNAQFNA